MDAFAMTITYKPQLEDVRIVEDGLAEHNSAYSSEASSEFALFLRNMDNDVVGGLLARLYYGCVSIRVMWIMECFRRKGHGSKLLALAEQEGRKNKCRFVYLDTFSFQARRFYELNGYEVFAVLDGFPMDQELYFMKKYLAAR